MRGLGYYCGLRHSTEILLLTLVGLIYTIFDNSLFYMKSNLEKVWSMPLSEQMFSPTTADLFKTVTSALVIVQAFTVHAYLAFGVVMMWPTLAESRPNLMVPWLMVAFVRNLVVGVVKCGMSLTLCYLSGSLAGPCVEFTLLKLVELLPHCYMWLSTFSFFSKLKLIEYLNSTKNDGNETENDKKFIQMLRRRAVRSMEDEMSLRQKMKHASSDDRIAAVSGCTLASLSFESSDVIDYLLRNSRSLDSLLAQGVPNAPSAVDQPSASLTDVAKEAKRTSADVRPPLNALPENMTLAEKVCRLLKIDNEDIVRARTERGLPNSRFSQKPDLCVQLVAHTRRMDDFKFAIGEISPNPIKQSLKTPSECLHLKSANENSLKLPSTNRNQSACGIDSMKESVSNSAYESCKSLVENFVVAEHKNGEGSIASTGSVWDMIDSLVEWLVDNCANIAEERAAECDEGSEIRKNASRNVSERVIGTTSFANSVSLPEQFSVDVVVKDRPDNPKIDSVDKSVSLIKPCSTDDSEKKVDNSTVDPKKDTTVEEQSTGDFEKSSSVKENIANALEKHCPKELDIGDNSTENKIVDEPKAVAKVKNSPIKQQRSLNSKKHLVDEFKGRLVEIIIKNSLIKNQPNVAGSNSDVDKNSSDEPGKSAKEAPKKVLNEESKKIIKDESKKLVNEYKKLLKSDSRKSISVAEEKDEVKKCDDQPSDKKLTRKSSAPTVNKIKNRSQVLVNKSVHGGEVKEKLSPCTRLLERVSKMLSAASSQSSLKKMAAVSADAKDRRLDSNQYENAKHNTAFNESTSKKISTHKKKDCSVVSLDNKWSSKSEIAQFIRSAIKEDMAITEAKKVRSASRRKLDASNSMKMTAQSSNFASKYQSVSSNLGGVSSEQNLYSEILSLLRVILKLLEVKVLTSIGDVGFKQITEDSLIPCLKVDDYSINNISEMIRKLTVQFNNTIQSNADQRPLRTKSHMASKLSIEDSVSNFGNTSKINSTNVLYIKENILMPSPSIMEKTSLVSKTSRKLYRKL